MLSHCKSDWVTELGNGVEKNVRIFCTVQSVFFGDRPIPSTRSSPFKTPRHVTKYHLTGVNTFFLFESFTPTDRWPYFEFTLISRACNNGLKRKARQWVTSLKYWEQDHHGQHPVTSIICGLRTTHSSNPRGFQACVCCRLADWEVQTRCFL